MKGAGIVVRGGEICERIKMRVGIWFNDNLRRVVGDSVNTFFGWTRGCGWPFSMRFSRLS